jgi:hypothetical protein
MKYIQDLRSHLQPFWLELLIIAGFLASVLVAGSRL